jgi:hypothetical protein
VELGEWAALVIAIAVCVDLLRERERRSAAISG